VESREPIFVAANLREVDFVERLLREESIEYEVRPETFERFAGLGTACYQGLLFEVLPGQATYCRKLLEKSGLSHGVIYETPQIT
jgi:hypothetical protein